MVNAIYAACQPLLDFPLSGAPRPQFASGLRVAFSGKYATHYVSDAASVIVVRVVHGARDAEAIADSGGFSV